MKLLKEYFAKKLEAGALASTFTSIAKNLSWNLDDLRFSIFQQAEGLSDVKSITIDEIYSIVEFSDNIKSVQCERFIFKEDKGELNYIKLEFVTDHLVLEIWSEQTQTLIDIQKLFVTNLGLVEFFEEKKENIELKIKNLEARFKEIEGEYSSKNKRLSCFISMRFDKKCQAYFSILEDFLKLLSIDVITGQSFEPRSISEKVSSKLNQKLDFVIYLISDSSESFWTRDELVKGKEKGYYLIPLIEKGAKFTQGILGDHEYIEFEPDHIERSFRKLLEGINFIKENRKFNIA